MKIDLQIRDLKTGETSQKKFESVEAAEAWLRERPRYTDVLGVASHHIDRDVSLALKAAKRPLDDEEKGLEVKLEAVRVEAAKKQAAEQRKKSEAAALKHQQEMATADPNRQMELRWRFDAGMMPSDRADSREISDEVKQAVEAWIAERNTWVEGRGQMVGEASVKVWPNTVPEGAERVVSGTFVPVTAPPKE